MLLEDYFDFVGPTEIRLKGHRIGIEHVLAYYQQGYTPEAIAQEFPGLDLEMVYATITYLSTQQSGGGCLPGPPGGSG